MTSDKTFMPQLLTNNFLTVFSFLERVEELEVGQCFKGKCIKHTEMFMYIRIIYVWD